MKQWMFSLGVFFMGLVIYTLVKAAWPDAVLLRVVVATASFGAVLWTWNKTNNKVNAKD
jgi:FtsH-binding integral membrane protein